MERYLGDFRQSGPVERDIDVGDQETAIFENRERQQVQDEPRQQRPAASLLPSPFANPDSQQMVYPDGQER